MYPTLFHIGSIRIDTYSVVWFIALSLAIMWSIKRLAIYNLDEDEARKVMAVSFLCMLIGARAPEYFLNWRTYINNPSLFLDLNRGGLHEFGAVLGAFISALVMCIFNKKISFMKLCDTAIIPAFLAIFVGRWGCFLNGCCSGLISNSMFAVHFPNDSPGIFRHPTQLYYSFIAGIIILILLYVEKKILPLQRKSRKYYSVIAPLGIILYFIMRYSVVPFRDYQGLLWMLKNTWLYQYMTAAFPVMFLWCVYSLLSLKQERH